MSKYRPRGSSFLSNASGALLGGVSRNAMGIGASGLAGYMAFDKMDEILKFVKTAISMAVNPGQASKIWDDAYSGKSEEEIRNESENKSASSARNDLEGDALGRPVGGSLRTTQADLSPELMGRSDVPHAGKDEVNRSLASGVFEQERASQQENASPVYPLDRREAVSSIDKSAQAAILSGDRSDIFGDFTKPSLTLGEDSFSKLPDLNISKMTMRVPGVSDPEKANVDLEIPQGAKSYEQVMAFNAQKYPELMNAGNVVSISGVNDNGSSTYRNFEVINSVSFRDYRSGSEVEPQGQWHEPANFRDGGYVEGRAKILDKVNNLDLESEVGEPDVKRIGMGLPTSIDKHGSASVEVTPSDLMSRISSGSGSYLNSSDDDIAGGLQRGAGFMAVRNGGFFSEPEYMKLSKSQSGVFSKSENDATRALVGIDDKGRHMMEFSLSHGSTEDRSEIDQSITITSGKETSNVLFSSLNSDGIKRNSIGQDIPSSQLRIEDGKLIGDEGNKSGKLMRDLGQKIHDQTGIESALGKEAQAGMSFTSVRSLDEKSGSFVDSEVAMNKDGNRFVWAKSGQMMIGEIDGQTNEMRVSNFLSEGIQVDKSGKINLPDDLKKHAATFLTSEDTNHMIGADRKIDKDSLFVPGISGVFSNEKNEAFETNKLPASEKDGGVDMIDNIINISGSHDQALDKKLKDGAVNASNKVASAGYGRD